MTKSFMLPSYKQCQENKDANPLNSFIYWNEPAKRTSETWRQELKKAIEYAIATCLPEGEIKKLWRDDGVPFVRNSDGTYSMEHDAKTAFEENPYRYGFSRLISTGCFSIYPPQKEPIKEQSDE